MTTTKAVLLVILLSGSVPVQVMAIGQARYIETTGRRNRIPLVAGGVATTIVVDAGDWPGVRRAAADLQADIARVTGITPSLVATPPASAAQLVIVGAIGRSPLIDRLVRERRIDVERSAGQVGIVRAPDRRSTPCQASARAIVIAGSDKRGTIYGIYDVSEQIGVSPWYWWADVVPDRKAASVREDRARYLQGEPSVKYRGIFLNDEFPEPDPLGERRLRRASDPATAAPRNFNAAFYARIFEVILRLKGNYLWPAMWNNAFAEDDPDNPRLADEYGIVMGSSHQEPMLRAQKEWDWHLQREHGNWNYATHPTCCDDSGERASARARTSRASSRIGLRGENDTEMVHGETESMALLEKIVDVAAPYPRRGNQPRRHRRYRSSGRLYKEVQNYYEGGLRVPDDVTLLWAEDNWGNVRRLPTAQERARPGGAGVYYHFDYHGGPRSYQWINTNPIAEDLGPDDAWPSSTAPIASGSSTSVTSRAMNFPTEFFLEPRLEHRSLDEQQHCATTPGSGRHANSASAHATEIADVLDAYPKFNGRRKPELLDAEYLQPGQPPRGRPRCRRVRRAGGSAPRRVYAGCPLHKRDAFYQLVLLSARGVGAGQRDVRGCRRGTRSTPRQGRASTNEMAARVRQLFKADQDLMTHFNKVFAGGKWDHFMDQPHIGYTSWRDPPPTVSTRFRWSSSTVPDAPGLGVAIDGSPQAWPGAAADPLLPTFDSISQAAPFHRCLQPRPRALRGLGDRRRPLDQAGGCALACGGRHPPVGLDRLGQGSRRPQPRQYLDLRRRPDSSGRGFDVQAGGSDENDGSWFRRGPGVRFDGSRAFHHPHWWGNQHMADG